MRVIMKAAIVIGAAVFMSGCAGLNAALEYDGSTLMDYSDAKGGWRFFDKPAEGRLMITPSLSRSAGEGFVSGLTLGIADTDIPKSEYQTAVEGFLAQSGRSCTVMDGYKLIRPQWEFKYVCRVPAAAQPMQPLPPNRTSSERVCTMEERVQARIAKLNEYTAGPSCD